MKLKGGAFIKVKKYSIRMVNNSPKRSKDKKSQKKGGSFGWLRGPSFFGNLTSTIIIFWSINDSSAPGRASLSLSNG